MSRFIAHDKDGRTIPLLISAEHSDTTTTGGYGEKETIRPLTVAETGEPVKRLSKGRYLVVRRNIEVTSNDPNAP